MRTPPALLPILLGLLCLPGGAAALAPSDLCTGNPCVIRGSAILEGGTLDFGAETDVRLARTAVLRFGVAREDFDVRLKLVLGKANRIFYDPGPESVESSELRAAVRQVH